jgi:large subunit ribosomal protein L27
MAHVHAGGKTRQKTARPGKRLGLKLSSDQIAKPGNILVRQRGTKFFPGLGVQMGKDHTLFAVKEGKIKFTQKLGKKILNVISPK